jgi:hypothetical protein
MRPFTDTKRDRRRKGISYFTEANEGNKGLKKAMLHFPREP